MMTQRQTNTATPMTGAAIDMQEIIVATAEQRIWAAEQPGGAAEMSGRSAADREQPGRRDEQPADSEQPADRDHSSSWEAETNSRQTGSSRAGRWTWESVPNQTTTSNPTNQKSSISNQQIWEQQRIFKGKIRRKRAWQWTLKPSPWCYQPRAGGATC